MTSSGRRFVGALLLRLLCLPTDVFGVAFVLLGYLCWGKRGSLSLRDGIVVFELAAGSWPARTWFRYWGGVTLGHAIMFGAGRARERLWSHEKVHVDQCEAAHVASAIAALLGFGVALLAGAPLGAAGAAAACVWSLGWLGLVLGALGAAWLRGGEAYADSVLERAAYALDGHDER